MKDNNTAGEESIVSAIGKLFQAWISLFVELWKLATLELRLAGKSLISILILGVALIILGLMLWIFLMAAGAAWLVSLHFSWAFAFLIIAAVHLLAIFWAIFLLAKAKHRLTFPETRKQLGLLGED